VRDARVTSGKSGKENAGEKCGTTGNKREYKMRDLIATTARRHESNADDVLYHTCSPIVILSEYKERIRDHN